MTESSEVHFVKVRGATIEALKNGPKSMLELVMYQPSGEYLRTCHTSNDETHMVKIGEAKGRIQDLTGKTLDYTSSIWADVSWFNDEERITERMSELMRMFTSRQPVSQNPYIQQTN